MDEVLEEHVREAIRSEVNHVEKTADCLITGYACYVQIVRSVNTGGIEIGNDG